MSSNTNSFEMKAFSLLNPRVHKICFVLHKKVTGLTVEEHLRLCRKNQNGQVMFDIRKIYQIWLRY